MRNVIRKLRESRGMSQEQLAELLGVKRSAVSKYENGGLQLTQSILTSLCNIFHVSADYILGIEDALSVRIPLLGGVQAGGPVFAGQEALGYLEAGARYAACREDYFALNVQGESMLAAYQPGDSIIVRRQSDCGNGRDAVVMVGDEEATLKRYYRQKGTVILKPLNPDFEQTVFSMQEAAELPVRVIGVVVELRRYIT